MNSSSSRDEYKTTGLIISALIARGYGINVCRPEAGGKVVVQCVIPHLKVIIRASGDSVERALTLLYDMADEGEGLSDELSFCMYKTPKAAPYLTGLGQHSDDWEADGVQARMVQPGQKIVKSDVWYNFSTGEWEPVDEDFVGQPVDHYLVGRIVIAEHE